MSKDKKLRLAYFGTGLFLIGTLLFVSSLYAMGKEYNPPQVYSNYSLLTSSWSKYKEKFIQEDGRVIDFSQDAITTSEGQSYAMLRSVWVDDKATFDKTWEWTKNNLKRPNDKLLGWRWGKRADETYGLMPNGGDNSATDGEIDISLALIMAHQRWGQDRYLYEAREILADLWKYNTYEYQGKRYMLAGNWALLEHEIVLNPSYFAPYAWRVFDKYDPERDWSSLIDPAYEILFKTVDEPFDTTSSSGLPPNWISINRQTGALQASSGEGLTTHYSFDAVRVPWRIAVDHFWFKEPRAKEYISQAFTTLISTYEKDKRLVSSYTHDGQPATDYENPVMYSTLLAALDVLESPLAEELYNTKILALYSNDDNGFDENIPYYEQNWLWFSMALHIDPTIPGGIKL